MTYLAVRPVYTRKAHAIRDTDTRTACGLRRRPTWPLAGSWRWLLEHQPRQACGACTRRVETT